MIFARAVLLAAMLVFAIRSPAQAGADDLAIIIAIKAYDHAHEVKFAHRDGDAMRDAAIRVLGIPKDRVLVRRDATYGQLRALFGTQEQPGQAAAYLAGRRAKRLWVYYTGHGIPGPGPGGGYHRYLLPKDGHPTSLQHSGLRLDELEETLEVLQRSRMAKDGQAILAIDACFSGRSNDGPLVPASSLGPIVLKPRKTPPLVVLAATQGDEVASWDSTAQHGLFTDLLLDTLFGRGGRDDKGQVTIAHLEALANATMASRLDMLFPGKGRTQRPVLEGPPTTVLATFSGVPPHRDPDGAASAAKSCQAYAFLEDPEVIARFLHECRECAPSCRQALTTRISDLSRRKQDCRSELRMVEAFPRGAKGALPGLQSLHKSLNCPEARERVGALIASLSEGVRTALDPPETWGGRKKGDPPVESDPKAPDTKAAIAECDARAAHPSDIDRKADGLELAQIDPRRAVAACQGAIAASPRTMRLAFQLGRALEAAKRKDLALRWYLQAAEGGYTAAMNNVATLLLEAQTADGERQAIRWLREAQHLGDARSIMQIALLHAEGRALPADDILAVHLMIEALEKHDRLATVLLLGRLNRLPATIIQGLQEQLQQLARYDGPTNGEVSDELIRAIEDMGDYKR